EADHPYGTLTMDFSGCPMCDSKNKTLSTRPCSSRAPFGVPKREDVDPFACFSDFAETSMGLRNSRNALMPKIADIASRISDMNRLSTVSANPWERIHAMP